MPILEPGEDGRERFVLESQEQRGGAGSALSWLLRRPASCRIEQAHRRLLGILVTMNENGERGRHF